MRPPLTLCFMVEFPQPDTSPEGIAQAKKAAKEKKRTPFFGSFFKQLLDPNVSISDRVTEFFAAALGKAISKMYESMGETSPPSVGSHELYLLSHLG